MKRWALLAVLAIAGCSPTETMAVDAGPDAAICQPGSLPRMGIVASYGTDGNSIAAASVCVEGRPDLCASSGADGAYTLCVPEATDYGLRVTAVGFEVATYLVDDSTTGTIDLEVGDVAFVTTLWADSQTTFPPTSSSLIFVSLAKGTGPLANAKVTIAPAMGRVTYGDANQLAKRTLTSSSTSGTVYIGDLAPGTYDITVTATPAVTCQNLSAPLSATPTAGGFESPITGAAVRAPTFSGVTTTVFLRCT